MFVEFDGVELLGGLMGGSGMVPDTIGGVSEVGVLPV